MRTGYPKLPPISPAESGFGFHGGTLHAGDVIRLHNGSYHYVEYVNSSGAYAVPLAGVTREIAGHTVNFAAGGRTISARSAVERIHPLQMGGSSPEYKRYVTLVTGSRKGTKGGVGTPRKGIDMADKGTSFGDFDAAELTAEQEAVEGHAAVLAAEDTIVAPNPKDKAMAKKAKAAKAGKANGAAKAARAPKPPKTVRNCACGCGTETTGYFAPGHDARMHGWIAKLADGRIEPKDIPASVKNKLDLVQTKEGFKAKAPHFWKQDE